MASLNPGKIINKTFQLIEKLGEGGMATVWLAKVLKPGLGAPEYVAIKFLKEEFVNRSSDTIAAYEGEDPYEDVRSRFEFAGRIHAQENVRTLRNITHFYGTGKLPDNTPYLIEEYFDGRTLADEIDERCLAAGLESCVDHRKDTRKLQSPLFPLDDVFTIMVELLLVERGLHSPEGKENGSSIIHRDIKPDNVMVKRNDSGEITALKLMDLGIAKVRQDLERPILKDRTRATQLNSILGTPGFMSPEQISFSADVTCATDVFSTGTMLFTLLTGRQPYSGCADIIELGLELRGSEPVDPCEFANGITDKLRDVVLTATARDLKERYANASEMLKEVQRAKNHYRRLLAESEKARMRFSSSSDHQTTIQSNRPGPKKSARPKKSHGSSKVMYAVGVLALVIGVIAGVLVLKGPFKSALEDRMLPDPIVLAPPAAPAPQSVPSVSPGPPAKIAAPVQTPDVRPLPSVVTEVPEAVETSAPERRTAKPLDPSARNPYEFGVLLMRSDYRKAIESLERAKRLSPDTPEVYEKLAECYRKTGQFSKASDADREARSLRSGM